MSGFSAEWLALRESADHAARSAALTDALAATLTTRLPLHVLDLACGTGSNLRYMLDRLAGPQQWLLADHDPALLAIASHTRTSTQAAVSTCGVDLASLDRARDLFNGRDLVTASALLDLVSRSWIEMLATICRDAGAAVLFALSYDGRIECDPEEADDAAVRDLVNAHQRNDKGFGAALGPDATHAAERAFTAAGYETRRARSDWVLTLGQSALQRELITGWAQAASEIAPGRAGGIDAWRAARLAHVAAGRSRIVVGHEDFAATR